MGKSRETESKVELDPRIEEEAVKNMELAKLVSKIPYLPNFGPQIAAFSPMQEASFKNTDSAASAFGMAPSGGTGLPKPENVGGFNGYSTKPLYENAVGQIPPDVLKYIQQMFIGPGGQPAGGPQPAAPSPTQGFSFKRQSGAPTQPMGWK